MASLSIDFHNNFRDTSLSAGTNQSGVLLSRSIDSNLPLFYANNFGLGNTMNDKNESIPLNHAVRPDFATRKAKGCSLNDEVHCSTGRCDDAVQRIARESLRIVDYTLKQLCVEFLVRNIILVGVGSSIISESLWILTFDSTGVLLILLGLELGQFLILWIFFFYLFTYRIWGSITTSYLFLF